MDKILAQLMHSQSPSTSSDLPVTIKQNCSKISTLNNCQPSVSTSTGPESNCSTFNQADNAATSQNGDDGKQAARKQAIKHVYKFFVDSLVSGTVIKYHRDSSINSIVGLSCKADNQMPVVGAPTRRAGQQNDSNSSAASSSNSSSRTLVPTRKQIECECITCHRLIAAARLAPHLEKCIGLGRNSSRVARKRLANFAAVKSQSASSSPRLNTRVSVCSSANETESVLDEHTMGADDDSEWRESQTPPDLAKKRRNNVNQSNGSSLPPNVQSARQQSRVRQR